MVFTTAVSSPQGISPPTVLIVEDDRSMGMLLRFLIEREGFGVRLITDGAMAKDAMTTLDPPGLILLDVMLPYADGFELLACIRSHPEWNRCPILMLTCRGGEPDIARAFEAGVDDYLVKPFHPDELKNRIRCLLGVLS